MTTCPGLPKHFPHPQILVYSSWRGGTQYEADCRRIPDEKRRQRVAASGANEFINPESYDVEVDLSRWFSAATEQFIANIDSKSQSISVLAENRGCTSKGWSLRRDHPTNAVILENHVPSNKAKLVLAHLPRLHNGEQTFVSLLHFADNDGWMRMVWNKGPQESYSVRDDANPYLPSIIARKRGLAGDEQTAKRRCLPFQEDGAAEESRSRVVKEKIGEADGVAFAPLFRPQHCATSLTARSRLLVDSSDRTFGTAWANDAPAYFASS